MVGWVGGAVPVHTCSCLLSKARSASEWSLDISFSVDWAMARSRVQAARAAAMWGALPVPTNVMPHEPIRPAQMGPEATPMPEYSRAPSELTSCGQENGKTSKG